MKRTHVYITSIVISLVVVGGSAIFLVNQAYAQNDIVAELRASLVQQNVPVRDIKITSRVPFQIEFTAQSASSTQVIEPDDPIYGALIQSELVSAQKRGVRIDLVKMIIVNSLGQTIFWTEFPADQIQNTLPASPSKVDNMTAAKFIQDQLPLNGLSLDVLDATQQLDGALIIKVTLSASDIETANKAVPIVMGTMSNLVGQLITKQGAQIASYKIEVFDVKGQPLLKYARVYSASEYQENWWQADGMTQDWFPHPPPPTTTPS
jgi:hypothetical protein